MVAVGRFRGCVAGTGDAFVLREKQSRRAMGVILAQKIAL
jgi:hypothetical protein